LVSAPPVDELSTDEMQSALPIDDELCTDEIQSFFLGKDLESVPPAAIIRCSIPQRCRISSRKTVAAFIGAIAFIVIAFLRAPLKAIIHHIPPLFELVIYP